MIDLNVAVAAVVPLYGAGSVVVAAAICYCAAAYYPFVGNTGSAAAYGVGICVVGADIRCSTERERVGIDAAFGIIGSRLPGDLLKNSCLCGCGHRVGFGGVGRIGGVPEIGECIGQPFGRSFVETTIHHAGNKISPAQRNVNIIHK